jgi:hypothetical protein
MDTLSHIEKGIRNAFNKKKTLFTSKLDLELRKKLVKCYIWSIALSRKCGSIHPLPYAFMA